MNKFWEGYILIEDDADVLQTFAVLWFESRNL